MTLIRSAVRGLIIMLKRKTLMLKKNLHPYIACTWCSKETVVRGLILMLVRGLMLKRLYALTCTSSHCHPSLLLLFLNSNEVYILSSVIDYRVGRVLLLYNLCLGVATVAVPLLLIKTGVNPCWGRGLATFTLVSFPDCSDTPTLNKRSISNKRRPRLMRL